MWLVIARHTNGANVGDEIVAFACADIDSVTVEGIKGTANSWGDACEGVYSRIAEGKFKSASGSILYRKGPHWKLNHRDCTGG